MNNDRGVALLMVITIVAILTVILADFTFETKLNKISIYNQQDRAQARLNAEAGLNFSMARLKIYQYARNMLEKNESIPISPGKIEALITAPFMYPIPVPNDAGPIAKGAAEEFIENTVIEGELAVTISPVRGFLNPNNLRITRKEGEDRDETDPNSPQSYLEKEFLGALRTAFEDERERNEEFDNLHSDADPELLLKELKFVVNDLDALPYEDRSEAEQLYMQKGITPKYAPMTSISEMYLLIGWDDDIVDLIKDQLTIHEVTYIPINEITQSQLKLLFPDITDEQSDEFFKYRDGSASQGEDEEDLLPHPFRNVEEFKNIVVNRLAIVSEETYDIRIDEFKTAGLELGIAGKLFRVESIGTFNRATYTIQAFVDLPVKQPTPMASPTPDPTPGATPGATPTPNPTGTASKTKLELLDPRVVEIIIN